MTNASVAIVNAGGANIASLRFALDRLGAKSELTNDVKVIRSATHVILPGVGAAAPAMQQINASGLAEVIPTLTQPVLGICLGMQLMAASSEEDDARCLGIFPGSAALLTAGPSTPVPNMGWCRLEQITSSPILHGIPENEWFYFVHSYALPVGQATVGTATHSQRFTAVIEQENFYATQFHPERSAHAGARLLQNFLEFNQ